MVALTVSHFSWMESVAARRVGNLPALLRPGPRRRGICLIRVSEARNASYFLANFLTTFLFLLNFLRPSTSFQSMPMASAFSTWTALPRTQIFMFGRGMTGSLKVPEKRLPLASLPSTVMVLPSAYARQSAIPLLRMSVSIL